MRDWAQVAKEKRRTREKDDVLYTDQERDKGKQETETTKKAYRETQMIYLVVSELVIKISLHKGKYHMISVIY